MPSPPAVSVCMPVFNGANFVAQAITSVVQQTYENFELVAIDDCSNDDSFNIIKTFAQKDQRIRILQNNSNLGLFANYNRCIEQSNGRYIKFLAQDDLLHKNNLQKTMCILEQNPTVSLVSTRRTWIDETGHDLFELEGTASSLYVPPKTIVSGHTVIRTSLDRCINFIGEPTAVIIRKEHCAAAFDTSYHHLGDLDLWLNTLRNGHYFNVDEPLCSVRIHTGNRSARNMRELLFAPDLVRLALRFEDLLPTFGDTYQKLLRRWAQHLCWHVGHLASTSQMTAAGLKTNNSINEYSKIFEQISENNEALNTIQQDLLAYRELLFYVAREANSISHSQSKKNKADMLRVTRLETRLRQLLQSPSWRATRWLRELNSDFHTVQALDTLRQSPDNADAYAEYLRQQISRIKNSRSWKLTSQFRKLGML